MSTAEFIESLHSKKIPDGISLELSALWYAGCGQWQMAHELVQFETDSDNARIHAYLHRIEGDVENAKFWYEKAKHKPSEISIQGEYEYLITYFLNKRSSCEIDF